MKNKSLIPNIAVLLVVALVCVLTGQIYLQQQKDDVLYRTRRATWISMSLTAGSPEARR